MQLESISLLGNRISGLLPKELGNISTLESLVIEYNQLSGTIPPELGKLPNIERLFLTSNNLTGELPGQLANLTTLKDFRISDNNFTGSIPDFIQNWTNLTKLVIQASGLNGPIPSGISFLTNLTDVRISDLNGNDTPFPLLGATKMKTLILRSCNMLGQLPDYLGSMPNMTFFYLTGNFLTGAVPNWMLTDGRSMNLFASSSKGNTSGIVSCLRSFQCPGSWYSLHINCGGREVKVNDTSYEADTDSGGASKFFQSMSNWAFSSTGNFLGDYNPRDSYIWAHNASISGNNSKLYMDARLSPLSLTYYGFCLLNGTYTVKLHFAEITFTDDRTYSSLGRRIFDIYIQGNLAWKDFNIEDEAGGINKPIIRNFTAVVTDQTLEIRLFWAGKGTNNIPVEGVYGPLISVISVNPSKLQTKSSSLA